MFINKFYIYILLKTWYLSLRIFSYSYSINISFYKFFRILRACSSSIEELTKLQSFPFTENPAHTFHDFFSKTFVFITSNSETNNRACMHRGANSSNWIQNNRVSISIRAVCLHTNAIALSRYAIKQEIVLYLRPATFRICRYRDFYRVSRVDLSYESNRSILQFITSRSRDRLSTTFDTPSPLIISVQ